MGYEKRSALKGIKKKDFPQHYEFLADIISKCILCKDTAFDTVSELQLKFMTAIVLKKKLNFGAILVDWIKEWIADTTTRTALGKPSPKMLYGRFISIILKKSLAHKIGDDEGDVLHYHKKITPRLFLNWKKNPHAYRASSKKDKSKGKRKAEEANKETVQKPDFGSGQKALVIYDNQKQAKKRKIEEKALEQKLKESKKVGDKKGKSKTSGKGKKEEEKKTTQIVPKRKSMRISQQMKRPVNSEPPQVVLIDDEDEDALKSTEEAPDEKLIEEFLSESSEDVMEEISGEETNTPLVEEETSTEKEENETERETDVEEVSEAQTTIPAPTKLQSRIVFEAIDGQESTEEWINLDNEQIKIISMPITDLLTRVQERTMNRTTILYESDSHLMFWFYPFLSWLKAISLGDTSFISWCFSHFPNMKMVTQNFPRVLTYTTKLLTNSQQFSRYRNFERIVIPQVFLKSKVSGKAKIAEANAADIVKTMADQELMKNYDELLETFSQIITTAKNTPGGEESALYKTMKDVVNNAHIKLNERDHIYMKKSKNSVKGSSSEGEQGKGKEKEVSSAGEQEEENKNKEASSEGKQN